MAVAAILDEGRLERGLHAGHFGEIDIAAERLSACRLEIKFFDAGSADHHDPGLLRVGGIDKHLVGHKKFPLARPPTGAARLRMRIRRRGQGRREKAGESRHVAGGRKKRSRQEGGSEQPLGRQARRGSAGSDGSPMVLAASYAPSSVLTCDAPARQPGASRLHARKTGQGAENTQSRCQPSADDPLRSSCCRRSEEERQPNLLRTPTDRTIRMCLSGRLTSNLFHYRQVMVICKSHDGCIAPGPRQGGSRSREEVVTGC